MKLANGIICRASQAQTSMRMCKRWLQRRRCVSLQAAGMNRSEPRVEVSNFKFSLRDHFTSVLESVVVTRRKHGIDGSKRDEGANDAAGLCVEQYGVRYCPRSTPYFVKRCEVLRAPALHTQGCVGGWLIITKARRHVCHAWSQAESPPVPRSISTTDTACSSSHLMCGYSNRPPRLCTKYLPSSPGELLANKSADAGEGIPEGLLSCNPC